jgi:hypothetical protein
VARRASRFLTRGATPATDTSQPDRTSSAFLDRADPELGRADGGELRRHEVTDPLALVSRKIDVDSRDLIRRSLTSWSSDERASADGSGHAR